MSKRYLLAGMLLASAAVAQTPNWTVALTPTLDPLPIGLCGAVHLTLRDPVTKDVPRNPQGYRITMADFDLTVSGTAVAGHQIDATHFETCGCQTGATGTSATITAKYPASNLASASRVPGVSFQQTATVTLGEVKGPVNAPSCLTLASNTPATAVISAGGGIAMGGAPIGRGTPRTPPVSPATPAPTAATTSVPVAPAANPPAGVAPDPRSPAGVVPPAPVATVAVTTPKNPSGLSAVESQPGEVWVQWNNVDDAEFYVAFGPGLASGGQRVEQGQSGASATGVNMTGVLVNVPAGLQEWAVASYYPGNVSTPAAAFPRVSVNVAGAFAATPPPAANPPPVSTPPPPAAAASGKYLVTITGIRAYQASMDDMLSRDGTGDEIYAAAYIRRYDRRDGKLLANTTRKSKSHGDTFHFASQRVQAGSSTPTGGIRDGDMIPGPVLIAMRSVLPQDATFPMQIWEGALTDGIDVVVISPSLWEQDVGEGFLNQWFQFQQTLNPTFLAKQGVQDQISQQALGSLVFGASANDQYTAGLSNAKLGADTLLMMFGGAVPILSLTTTTQDRPIGLAQNTRDSSVLPNHTVVLTREIIEKALASPALGAIPSPVANSAGGLNTPAIARIGVAAPKPGIVVVHFQDNGMLGTAGLPERPAIYQMFLQVERMP